MVWFYRDYHPVNGIGWWESVRISKFQAWWSGCRLFFLHDFLYFLFFYGTAERKKKKKVSQECTHRGQTFLWDMALATRYCHTSDAHWHPAVKTSSSALESTITQFPLTRQKKTNKRLIKRRSFKYGAKQHEKNEEADENISFCFLLDRREPNSCVSMGFYKWTHIMHHPN